MTLKTGLSGRLLTMESSRAIVKEFDKQGKTNLTYIEYKNWNHFFNNNFEVILKDIGAESFSVWLRQKSLERALLALLGIKAL